MIKILSILLIFVLHINNNLKLVKILNVSNVTLAIKVRSKLDVHIKITILP